MWVCARCLGVQVGMVLGVIVAVMALGASWPVPLLLSLAAGATALGLLDWGLQHWGGLPSTNARRLISGILLGVGAMQWGIVFPTAVWLHLGA